MIVWSELAGAPPPWLVVAQLGVLAVALLGSLVWDVLEPLRRFLTAMLALLVLLQLPSRIDLSWLPLRALFGASAFDARMQAEQTEKVLVTAAFWSWSIHVLSDLVVFSFLAAGLTR